MILFFRAHCLCQQLVRHGAHDIDSLLLGLDNVAGLGILGKALESADEGT